MTTKSLPTKNGKKGLQHWYHEYWAQTWYRTTFLVKRPDQIARTIDSEAEWNNIYQVGCHFTCLATIVAIDPARLASMLSTQKFFRADGDLPAKRLTGKVGGLVWDQNVPNHDVRSVVLKGVWHPRLNRRTSISISFVKSRSTYSYAEGKRLVAVAHAKGRHVVCGPEAHAHLVAGTVGNRYFVWDPDDTTRSVEENLSGGVTLRRLFDENKSESIDFLEYRVELN